MASDAVGSERISRVVGYKITKGDFSNVTPNLPQRIAILGEANVANQAGITADVGIEINSAQEAGTLFGYGSPIHMAMRILRPNAGDGIGGIPTIVYPQAEGAAVAKVMEATVTTAGATGNATHTIKVAGRTSLDGVAYTFDVVDGDTDIIIAGKISDALNAVLGCPFLGTSALAVATATAKWKGLTSEDLTLSIDDGGNGVGVTYAIITATPGSVTPDVSTALNNFGNDWNTLVVNTYGVATTVMDALEAFNGIPDPTAPTGRYTGIVFKPFVALTGSVADEDIAITDARLDDVTIAICPAPLSTGHPLEAASNVCLLYARTAQDTPHLDISGRTYPDMPTPTDIGTMADYNNRDVYVKKGNSTVDLLTGKYRVQDFVTTYHPVGETPPQFRYPRNLIGVDFNIKFTYQLLEEINVVDHVIAGNDDAVTVSNVIKPKQWTAILNGMAEDLVKRGLITDAPFMQDSIEVDISGTNPDRLETFFRYKRTGTVRIAATTAEAGFNFGEA